MSDSYSTVLGSSSQILQSFQNQSQCSNNQIIEAQNVIDEPNRSERGNREGISEERSEDDIFGFHDGWCVFFAKQCNLVFQCCTSTVIILWFLFVLWRLFIF